MNVEQARQFFRSTANCNQRRYEALRALFISRQPLPQVARRFGYAPASLRNLRAAFLRQSCGSFFLPDPRGRSQPHSGPQRDRRIVALRAQRNLSAQEIAHTLSRDEDLPVSPATVARVLHRFGFPKLRRRTRSQLAAVRGPQPAPVSDHRRLDLSDRQLRTDYGGLFLFAPDLARLDLDGLLARHQLPGSDQLPAGCAVRSLLALKLWGVSRPSHIDSETLDPGLALFAGLNAIPKRSSLTEYSCRVDPRSLPPLMDDWHQALRQLDAPLGTGQSFDLDFHSIPFHGSDELLQRHYVSKRSRSQKSVLAFLVRDADSHVFAWADANVRKQNQHAAVLRFAEAWRKRTGQLPAELVFDSRLTTYPNLSRLDQLGIRFLTLRRRSRKMVAALLAAPASAWRKVRLTNIGRIYRTPRVQETQVRLGGYSGPVRQIAVIDLGHEQPTLLITNDQRTAARQLIDRYARRMVIENLISDAVNFFHLDALSSSVPLREDCDVQLTLMASALYRLLGQRAGDGFLTAEAATLFRKLVRGRARIELTAQQVRVVLGRRSHAPVLQHAGYADLREPIPWLGNRVLRIQIR